MDRWLSWTLFLFITLEGSRGADDSYNTIHRDGSYELGYNTPDSYHYADANRNNVVKGEFGGRNPGTGAIDTTVYTAGPRGFRPRGKNVARKYDLNQSGPRPVGSRDDPYYDPYEDPSYSFSFRTRAYQRQEHANRVGDVNGKYSYIDDVGEKHDVEFIAGKNTGFHVKTPFPDSNPRAYGPLYFNGRGKPIPRGRTSIQRGLDGSYRFVSAGPDQRRTETSDSTGHVRGSYTYLDDKGTQHSVHYIAGPETGYRVLKTVKGPHIPTVFPFGRPGIIPPDFYDYKDSDLFDTAASGHVKPGGSKPSSKEDEAQDAFSFGSKLPGKPSRKPPTAFGGTGFGNRPSYEDEDTDDFGDLFGGGGGSSSNSGGGGTKPLKPSGQAASQSGERDKSSEDDDSYKPLPTKPGFDNLPRPGGLATTSPTFRPPTTASGVKPGKAPGSSVDYGGGYSAETPTVGFEEGSNEVGSSLFGSASESFRPPFNPKPVIHVGGVDESCKKCEGTIVTNVGDKLFTVPPGVSVRAHVQAIDLVPISPSVPSPSEQYKFDTSLRTEQLNEASNQVVSTKSNGTENASEKSNSEETVTTTVATGT